MFKALNMMKDTDEVQPCAEQPVVVLKRGRRKKTTWWPTYKSKLGKVNAGGRKKTSDIR